MIGDPENLNDEAEDFAADVEDFEEPEAASIPNANVGETSVEIDVEELIAELEADCGVTSKCESKDPRKRLECILEERRTARELEEIDEFAYDTQDLS